MKNKILAIFLILIAVGCGVSSNTKELLNGSFRNTLRDLYGEQGIYITDFTTEVVSMNYDKEGDYYKSKEPGYYSGLIKCEFKDGNTKVSIWFDVGFDKYWHVQKLPEMFGNNKFDIHVSDILVWGLEDYKQSIESKYVLDRQRFSVNIFLMLSSICN